MTNVILSRSLINGNLITAALDDVRVSKTADNNISLSAINQS